eukprot:6560312-Pyramimonas_sp.AAC.1
MFQRVPKGKKTPWNVWFAFCRCWLRVFGPPEFLVVDEGKEFMGTFADRASEAGCLAIYAKACELEPPETRKEAEALVLACEAAKNRFVNRFGVAPVQRLLGELPHLPGSLLSDDWMDARMLTQDPDTEMPWSNRLRMAAHRAVMEADSRNSIKRVMASGAKPRVQVQPGDWARVWRKFSRDSGDKWSPDFKKDWWVGPCVVLMVKDASVWVNHKGELWQCSLEKVRVATSDECRGAELL